VKESDGRNVEPRSASSHVFGFVPVIDCMTNESDATATRGIGAAIGPWIVTADEWQPDVGVASALQLPDDVVAVSRHVAT
jgi:hypothetical protein